MAAYISRINNCQFCIGTHAATASQASGNAAMVAAVLAELESAPIEEPLRATLRNVGQAHPEGQALSR